jgi:hypothetical protein
MLADQTCCFALFDEFTFADMRIAEPPALRGVYAIRIRQRGRPLTTVIEQAHILIARLNWPIVTKKAHSRIDRIARISDCATLYIGSAGTYTDSKNTLRGRYSEFAGRHTIMFPLWALLMCGWELEYGWKATEAASEEEVRLKTYYRHLHQNRLPALVHR